MDVDGALTVGQLKDVIEDESFIPADLQRLSAGGRDLTTGTLEDNELADGTSIELLLNVAGGGEAEGGAFCVCQLPRWERCGASKEIEKSSLMRAIRPTWT